MARNYCKNNNGITKEEPMRITEKGQVTIPQEIREKYGLLPESEVHFVEGNGGVFLRKIPRKNPRGIKTY